MARPMGHIRIMFSSRVLLNLEEADAIFKKAFDAEFAKGKDKDAAHEAAVTAYSDYMCCRGEWKKDFDPAIGGRRLEAGPLLNMAAACLKLNGMSREPVVEVGVSCKDEQDTARVVFRNLDLGGLADINFRRATAGRNLTKTDHETFGTDLFLTRNLQDAQNAVDLGIAASCIHLPEGKFEYRRKDKDAVRIWVDGDAVAFGSSAEVRYRTEGLTVYRELEKRDFDKSIEPGPFSALLAKISELNSRFPRGRQPFEIALVTARGAEAAARVLTIAEDLGFKFNGGMYFMGGAAKVSPLKAHCPDIFFDDQVVHLNESSAHCPTGFVPYAAGSAMHEYQEKQKLAAQASNASEQKPATDGGKRKRAGGPKAPKP